MTPRLFVFCFCLAALAGCASTPDDKVVKKPTAPEVSGKQKKEQEARFIKDIYRALEEGNVATADALRVRVLYINPKSVEARLARGEIFLRQARYGRAMETFKSLVKEEKLLARSYQGIGVARLQQGRRAAAKQAFDKAVSLDGGLWRAWNGLGYFYDSVKDWKRAQQSYNRALKLRRDKPALFNNRGFSKLMQSRYEDAIVDFRAALKLNPLLKVTRMNIRLAQAWLGRYVEAIAGASKQDLPSVLNNIGYIAMIKGEYAAADAYFSRAMQLSPSFNETASNNLQKLEAFKSQSRPKGTKEKR
ncbi:MAG: tetratricopeptide repeat protein [Alphaproteobacteria bacterium]|nr:tetratricopeptide repeat protein [Alphaproteobacteria bacterium]MCZ6814178.1 tetratricopeptide repeat protein [Alphaproteobacteria bacterium]